VILVGSLVVLWRHDCVVTLVGANLLRRMLSPKGGYSGGGEICWYRAAYSGSSDLAHLAGGMDEGKGRLSEMSLFIRTCLHDQLIAFHG